MKTYIQEIFDSHNTSFNRDIKAQSFKSAINKARKYNCKKQIVHDGSDWVELEGQEIISATALYQFSY